ncbi:MAG: VWA domain-containing protein [Myxococcales bacterium]|nr:VWA domain-containing protein [Myxococcales bacterium]MCB9718662.1 VWA domain-containing protein [Myxococcales bacterium]
MTIDLHLGRACGLAAALGLLSAAGCASDDGSDGAGLGDEGGQDGGDEGGPDDGGEAPLGPGVGQGGAQDFGQFRAILEAGGIPGPETLDDVGFFNEHKIPFPAPECGDDVCLHGALGVMGNMLSGANCTLVLLGMNTPIDPAEIERPPLNLAIAVDTSGSMAGEPIEHVREGLRRMSDVLRPEDRVSIVAFADQAAVLAEAVEGSSAALQLAIAKLEASGSTNIYDGLRTAYEVVDLHGDPERQNRVMLLSDGQATTGLLNDARVLELGTAYAIEGIGLSTVGLGLEFDPSLMRGLAERGGGAFYFLEDDAAVEEVFEEEAQALLLPLASEVEIDVQVGAGYELRGMYGTKLATLGATAAHLEIPSLHIAHRESTGDTAGGRRGGGGAIVAELMPRPGATSDGGRVGTLTMRYRVPGTDEEVFQETEIESALAPGETPAEGRFDTDGSEKAFVTLNLYMGFMLAAERAQVGDDAGALNLLRILHDNVALWLSTHEDADISDDQRYVELFMSNLMARGAPLPPPAPAPEPWPTD